MKIECKYIVDEKDNKIAVQLDIKTFEKIEEVLENYALFHLMEDDRDDEVLDLDQAKNYYETLKK